MTSKPQYIVLMAVDEGAYISLVELLKPHIGDLISYIDTQPEVINDKHDGVLLKVDR